MWNFKYDQVLRRFLTPVPLERFLSEYYERKVLYLPRNDAQFFQGDFSLAEVDRFLHSVEISASFLHVLKDGVGTPVAEYSRNVPRSDPVTHTSGQAAILDPGLVGDFFARGHTLHFDHIRSYSPQAAALCRELEGFFGHRIRCTAFLTPSHSKGFRLHYDVYDTFILQIHGSKRWRVSETMFPLPLVSQFYTPDMQPGPLLLDTVLRPGDFLYMPRGTFHEAAADDEASLHLSIVPDPLRWEAVFHRVLSEVAKEELPLRSSTATPLNEEELEVIGRRVFSRVRSETAKDELELDFYTTRRNDGSGQLQQILDADRITPLTQISIRAGSLYSLSESDLTATVRFSAKVLQLPRSAAEIVRALELNGPMPVAAFLKYDGNALAIARTLLKSGFLMMSAEPEKTGAVRVRLG